MSEHRNMHIRQAHRADLDVLVRELGQQRFFDDRISRQSERLGMLLVAWQGIRPIGVIYLWLEEAEEPELREHLPGTPILNNLEVHLDYRGAGVGTKLISAAERRLGELGFHRVALGVEIANRRALQLYRRLGYKEWEYPHVHCYSMPDDDGKRYVEVCQIMVKTLRRES